MDKGHVSSVKDTFCGSVDSKKGSRVQSRGFLRDNWAEKAKVKISSARPASWILIPKIRAQRKEVLKGVWIQILQ